MKITKLHVEGYRSFKDVTWEPGDLNVVIGPNASGKSNLLRIFDLLSVSARGGLSKHIQREGGMGSILWDGNSEELKLEISYLPYPNKDTLKEWYIRYLIEIKLIPLTSLYIVGNESLYSNYDGININSEKKTFDRNDELFNKSNYFIENPDHCAQESMLSILFPNLLVQRNISTNHILLFSNMPIFNDFHTDRNSIIRKPTVTRFDKQLEPDGQNLINVLHTFYTENRTFKSNINEAMNAAFGEEFEELIFTPASDNYIQMRIRWRSLQREQPAADLSDGTLRFLYLLAILANPEPAPLIAIDEPETGLHPRMFPIIAEFAREASAKSQVIFTTHSPDFLHAFRDPVTTTVVDWKDGQTQLRVLSDDELSYWLKEYTLGDLFRSGELEAMG